MIDPTHLHLMDLALDEARAALATGDVPIGALILGPDGNVLATGRNEREAHGDPTAHAEVLAIHAAADALRAAGNGDGWRLEDCTLVVTLEPCAMCAGAIVLSRIPKVVFGAWDEKAGAVGSVFDILREPRLNHWVEVYPAWPGNVRELRNFTERLALFLAAEPLQALTPGFMLSVAPELARGATPADAAAGPSRESAAAVLARFGGQRDLAADHLGISRTTLWRRLKAEG